MDDSIRSRFDDLETALDALISSITSYNPSVAAAEALVQADDELSHSLEQLVTHQRNYQTIARLRATAAALDDRITGSLTQLAEARDALNRGTPVSLPAEGGGAEERRVQADELLMFAQHIARYTVPPTYREPLPPHIKTEAAPTLPNGVGPHVPAAARAAGDDGAAAAAAAALSSEGVGKAVGDLAPEIKAWLEPPEHYATFTPWPADDVARRGALGRIEEAWERGVDPGSADIAAEMAVKAEE